MLIPRRNTKGIIRWVKPPVHLLKEKYISKLYYLLTDERYKKSSLIEKVNMIEHFFKEHALKLYKEE